MPDNMNYQFAAVPGGLVDYVKDKSKSSKAYFRYLLARTIKMFQYKNLPDTIPQDILERLLQVNGCCCITEYNGSLYAFNGSLGGEQDVYYRPTIFVVSNPHLSQQFSKEVLITDQLVNLPNSISDQAQQRGVLMRNDTEWFGLTALIGRYAALMAENCVTVRSADVMLRILALLSAPDDKTKKSAEIYLAKLEKGEFGIISERAFTDGIKMQSPPSNNGSYLTQFIELQQYFKGSFFNELGLRANYNMKREAIGQGESTLDEDAILPLCDNMLQCRKEDVQRINDLYNTNISVDFSSAWLQNRLEYSISMISQLGEGGVAHVGSDGDDMSQLESSGVEMDERLEAGGDKDDDNSRDQETGENNRETGQGNSVSDRETELGVQSAGESGEAEEVGEEGAEGAEGAEINNIEISEVVEEMVDVVSEAVSQLEGGEKSVPQFEAFGNDSSEDETDPASD